MVPYYFTFTTFTKGRWVGETILTVFSREFRAQPRHEYVSWRIQNTNLILLSKWHSLLSADFEEAFSVFLIISISVTAKTFNVDIFFVKRINSVLPVPAWKDLIASFSRRDVSTLELWLSISRRCLWTTNWNTTICWRILYTGIYYTDIILTFNFLTIFNFNLSQIECGMAVNNVFSCFLCWSNTNFFRPYEKMNVVLLIIGKLGAKIFILYYKNLERLLVQIKQSCT